VLLDTLSNKVSSVRARREMCVSGGKRRAECERQRGAVDNISGAVAKGLGLVDGEYGGSGKGRKEGTGDEGTLITDYLINWSMEGDIKRALGLDR